jgi:hypothetical protein
MNQNPPPRPSLAETNPHNIMYRLEVTVAEMLARGGDPWWVSQIQEAAQRIHNLSAELMTARADLKNPPTLRQSPPSHGTQTDQASRNRNA